MGPMLVLICLSAQATEAAERDWTRASFAATPVCAADHAECRGTATLAITTEDGVVEVDRCDVRAGARFVLALDDVETFSATAGWSLPLGVGDPPFYEAIHTLLAVTVELE